MPETKVKEKVKAEEAPNIKTEPAVESGNKSGGMLKLIIIFGIMQVMLAAGAFLAIKMVVLPKTAALAEKPAEEAKAAPVESEPREIYLVDNIIVNPAGTNGTRYLSTSIGLEIEKSEESVEHMREKTPVVRDILIAVFSSKSLEELGSGEGKELIRKDILEKVNQALSPGSVSKVFFVDYVLQ